MPTILIGATIVGLILGLLGSGGSAIMVPILVYLVGHEAKISIAESMAIVGAISVAGAIPFARRQQVDWQSVLLFGLPAMLGTFVGAWLGGMATDAVQLTVFGAVLLLAAVFMIRKAFGKKASAETAKAHDNATPDPLRPLVRQKGKSRVIAAQIRELQSDDWLIARFVIDNARSKTGSDVSIIPGATPKHILSKLRLNTKARSSSPIARSSSPITRSGSEAVYLCEASNERDGTLGTFAAVFSTGAKTGSRWQHKPAEQPFILSMSF